MLKSGFLLVPGVLWGLQGCAAELEECGDRCPQEGEAQEGCCDDEG